MKLTLLFWLWFFVGSVVTMIITHAWKRYMAHHDRRQSLQIRTLSLKDSDTEALIEELSKRDDLLSVSKKEQKL